MIKLEIEDYCQDCPAFEPETERLYSTGYEIITTIRCENQNKCRKLVQYLERKVRNAGNGD